MKPPDSESLTTGTLLTIGGIILLPDAGILGWIALGIGGLLVAYSLR